MIEKTTNPTWNDSFTLYAPYHASRNQLKISVFDFDKYSSDDSLGEAVINVETLQEGNSYDQWIQLKNPEQVISSKFSKCFIIFIIFIIFYFTYLFKYFIFIIYFFNI